MLRSGGAHSDGTAVLLGDARQPVTDHRLPWPMAAVVILGLSLSLWSGIWAMVVRLLG